QLALWCVLAGGALYNLGVIFHAWRRVRFQHGVWHCFVLLGAGWPYTPVLALGLARPPKREGGGHATGEGVVVTGGAPGIGKALCEAFHGAGAAKVVVTDIDGAGARAAAAGVKGAAFQCDVAKEKDILHVIDETERQFGPIALFCSNAGIGGGFD